MKHLKLKVGKVYEIVWRDAYGIQAWKSSQEHCSHEPWECKTIGYYVGKNKGGDLLFASDKDQHGSIGGVQGRPEAMIRKVRLLR